MVRKYSREELMLIKPNSKDDTDKEFKQQKSKRRKSNPSPKSTGSSPRKHKRHSYDDQTINLEKKRKSPDQNRKKKPKFKKRSCFLDIFDEYAVEIEKSNEQSSEQCGKTEECVEETEQVYEEKSEGCISPTEQMSSEGNYAFAYYCMNDPSFDMFSSVFITIVSDNDLLMVTQIDDEAFIQDQVSQILNELEHVTRAEYKMIEKRFVNAHDRSIAMIEFRKKKRSFIEGKIDETTRKLHKNYNRKTVAELSIYSRVQEAIKEKGFFSSYVKDELYFWWNERETVICPREIRKILIVEVC
jgi:hypothetical protein